MSIRRLETVRQSDLKDIEDNLEIALSNIKQALLMIEENKYKASCNLDYAIEKTTNALMRVQN